jgi:hypothetical protein
MAHSCLARIWNIMNHLFIYLFIWRGGESSKTQITENVDIESCIHLLEPNEWWAAFMTYSNMLLDSFFTAAYIYGLSS